MRSPQVSAWIPLDTKAAFEAYAEEQGLPAAVLLGVLVSREMKVRRLCHAAAADPESVRRLRGTSASKITVRHRWAREFKDYVQEIGAKKSAAAGWLVTQELQEKWIGRALAAEETTSDSLIGRERPFSLD